MYRLALYTIGPGSGRAQPGPIHSIYQYKCCMHCGIREEAIVSMHYITQDLVLP